ncbi:MAG: ABC transporter ATP-binding protein [Beijerinckiaceae bacterium]|nr:ABC transporter ATP-binding protein [Beijerinckiaceae bacterium]
MSFSSQSFRELRLEGVAREFGSVSALKDVTLDIKRGEFIALLGPSGCGKSTALNCLAGLLPTTRGAIWLDDKRIDTLRPEERGFGMVFQSYALFPHMNVRKNIGFGLRMKGRPKAEIAAKVDEALGLVRLQNQAEKLPGQLSGGQQQRVAIARAIVIEPPLVLMDEPLSNLDAKLRIEMRGEIRRIHNQLGATTIYVTHDQDEALSLADRIVVLRDGTIRQVGTPEELYARPSHLDVADFMGYRNKISGRVVSTDSRTATIAVGDGEVTGTLRETLSGDMAVIALRPEDLTVSTDGKGIPARVETLEYRGHEFQGLARGPGGIELIFSSHTRLPTGSEVRLKADPAKSLAYAQGTQ